VIVRQFANESLVCRCPIECFQLSGLQPGQLFAINGTGLSFDDLTGIEEEKDVFFRVTVKDDFQDASHTNLDSQLFGELSLQALLGRLVRFQLAARELPVPLHVASGFSTGGKDKAIAADDAGSDQEKGELGHRRIFYQLESGKFYRVRIQKIMTEMDSLGG
jgi:hypothetical protein